MFIEEYDKHQNKLAKGLLKICEDLHMSNTSAYPDLTEEDRNLYLRYLVFRLRIWKPERHSRSAYDEAVKSLIKETINETLIENDRKENRENG